MEQETKQNNDEKFDYDKSLKKKSDAHMQKIKFVDAWINRPLASLIVKAVFKTRITPNDLTYISGLFGLLGAISFTRGQYLFFIIGAVLAQLSSIVDGADGMLARAKSMGSEYGAHLDLLLDRIIDFFILSGIGLGAAQYFKNPTLALLGIFGAGLYLLQIHLFYLTKSYLNIKDKGDTGEARAILYWLIVVFSVVNRLDIAIYVLLAETIINTLWRFVSYIRMKPKP